MFNKLKQIKDLRDKAKEIQGVLADEMIESEKKGIKIRIDGNQKVHEVHIVNEDLMQDKVRLQAALVEAFNGSIKDVQKAMAKKLQGMDGFDLPGLS